MFVAACKCNFATSWCLLQHASATDLVPSVMIVNRQQENVFANKALSARIATYVPMDRRSNHLDAWMVWAVFVLKSCESHLPSHIIQVTSSESHDLPAHIIWVTSLKWHHLSHMISKGHIIWVTSPNKSRHLSHISQVTSSEYHLPSPIIWVTYPKSHHLSHISQVTSSESHDHPGHIIWVTSPKSESLLLIPCLGQTFLTTICFEALTEIQFLESVQSDMSSSACPELNCQFGGVCKLIGKTMECVCPASCPVSNTLESSVVCGSDGQSYVSECRLKQFACRLQQRIVVAHPGPCEGQFF